MFKLNEENSKNYKIVSTKRVDEQNIDIVELIHNVTRAHILLFITDDENRVFNIAFKTPVDNSKGTPHILEHSVLCGSRKYNIKDPFIELAKGSLNTFLNAMTFPDKTCYPVASANLKDFHNLMDVYLDAVFYPNAIKDKRIFMQEGWHFEVDEKTKDLSVNGVVYNEMKGVFSSPEQLLESAILKNAYSDTNYAHEYGGDPKDINSLSYEEFVDFHHKYYSASNSIIYYYGKLDFNYELSYLQNEYLANFDYIECDAKMYDAKENIGVKEEVTLYNVDTENAKDKGYLAYTFVMPKDKDRLKTMALRILEYLIFSSDGAKLKDKLQSLGMGESIFTQMEFGLSSGFISIVAQNIDENKKDDFMSIVNNYFSELLTNGIDETELRASINATHFDYAEDDYNSLPRGLSFILTSLDSYLYSGDYSKFLEYKEAFDYFKDIDLSDKNNIFYNTIREYFVDNNRKSLTILSPKYNYLKEKNEELSKTLFSLKENLTKDELSRIELETKDLKAYQSSETKKEDYETIPSLKVSDLDDHKDIITYIKETNNNVETIACFENNSEIAYCDLYFDVTDFTKEEIYLLSIVKEIIGQIDLSDESYQDFAKFVDLFTGGYNVGIAASNDKTYFTITSKAVLENYDYIFDVFNKLLSKTVFLDKSRINILINECRASSEMSVISSGHAAAMNRAKSTISYSAGIFDKIKNTGIAHFEFINQLCKIYNEKSDLINEILMLLFRKITYRDYLFTYSVKKENKDKLINAFCKYNENIKENHLTKTYTGNDEALLKEKIKELRKYISFDEFDMSEDSEAIITPSDINFVALSSGFDKDLFKGSVEVIKQMLDYDYLWNNIRVIGGAYGCMSSISYTGNVVFGTYRDPNLETSNKTFLNVEDYINNLNKSENEVTKSIIGAMRFYDNPLGTFRRYSRNISAYLNHLSNDDYNNDRKDIMQANISSLKSLAIIFSSLKSNNCRCALISAKDEDAAKKTYKKVWKLIK